MSQHSTDLTPLKLTQQVLPNHSHQLGYGGVSNHLMTDHHHHHHQSYQ